MYHQDINDALPLVYDLIRKYKCVVHIGMYDAGTVRFVLKVSAEDAVELPTTFLGAKKPAYSTSTGKVLLAYNPSFVQPTVARGLVRESQNTITSTYNLRKELSTIKKNGYALSDNENDTQTFAIAAPITAYSGQTVAALNMVGSIDYMNSINQRQAIQDVVRIAKLISKHVGYIENE
ncbi:IclR family transcriptional regulator [Salicibibacter kimchii]